MTQPTITRRSFVKSAAALGAACGLGVAVSDDLVNVDYGWWHPEWEPGGPDLGGMWESNVNCLTSCEPGEPLIGTWSYNAIDCVLRRIAEPLSWE